MVVTVPPFEELLTNISGPETLSPVTRAVVPGGLTCSSIACAPEFVSGFGLDLECSATSDATSFADGGVRTRSPSPTTLSTPVFGVPFAHPF